MITSERSERSSNYHLVDIQTVVIPLKKAEKLKYIFMTILGLAESFKTMNRPDPVDRNVL